MKKEFKTIVGIVELSCFCVSTVFLSMGIYSRIKDAIIKYGDGRFMDGINKGYRSGFQQAAGLNHQVLNSHVRGICIDTGTGHKTVNGERLSLTQVVDAGDVENVILL